MIALALMLKDTEPTEMVTRCIASVGPYIDGIYITITHNTKNPGKDAKNLARDLKVFCISKGYPEPEISYFKWVKDFAAGRNYNWSQIPEEYEWIFWLDADDILVGGENMEMVRKKAVEIDSKAVFLNYIYKADVDTTGGKLNIKNVLIEHLRERLIRNDGSYKWIGPIHETLIEQRQTNKTDNRDMYVLHLSNDDRSMDAIHRNIEILENTLKEQGKRKDPRIVYYLGKAYFDLHTEEAYAKAEDLIERYLHGSDTNTPSGWEEERGQAWAYLSEIHRNRGHINKAIKATANAIIESPKFPQFYIDMALNYIYLKRYDKALHWARLFDKIPYPKTTLVMNPRDMQARLHEVMFNVGTGTGNIEMAWSAAVQLTRIFPNEPSIIERMRAIDSAKVDNEVAHSIIKTAQYIKQTGTGDMQALLGSIPEHMRDEPIMLSLWRDYATPRRWADNEIAIVCGPGFEKWSPENLKDGIGGSEEAVIHNGRELAKLGWKVTVYADPPDGKYVDGNVTYLSHYKFNPKDEFNILIGWRMPQFFNTKWNAKRTYLWLHDVQNPLEYTKERVDNIDKIFVLSEAHKATLINPQNKEYLTDDKFLLTGNGIDVKQIEALDGEFKRNPKRVIWTSSYDRGIEHLLDIWSEVIKEVPRAELHIFYGWNLYDKVNHNNPERQAWKAKINQKMKQKGITHHGRVGQDKILEETFKSGIWAYPTHFYEISCITAMKCQAAGAIPVVCDYAALKETVQHGVKINVDEEDIYEDSVKREFKNQLIKTMRLGNIQEDVREPMMKWARNKFGWDKIAAQWDKEFKDGLHKGKVS